jgi:hypothetical protein
MAGRQFTQVSTLGLGASAPKDLKNDEEAQRVQEEQDQEDADGECRPLAARPSLDGADEPEGRLVVAPHDSDALHPHEEQPHQQPQAVSSSVCRIM